MCVWCMLQELSSDVVSHQADLRFMSMAVQKYMEEAKVWTFSAVYVTFFCVCEESWYTFKSDMIQDQDMLSLVSQFTSFLRRLHFIVFEP